MACYCFPVTIILNQITCTDVIICAKHATYAFLIRGVAKYKDGGCHYVLSNRAVGTAMAGTALDVPLFILKKEKKKHNF